MLVSIMKITSCAFSIVFFDFIIPIFSISSLGLSRNPAVSINRHEIPLISISISIVSRVVPAIEETIARSSLAKAFNRDDFPTLGFPIIAIGRPFFIISPFLKFSNNFFIFKIISSTLVV